jgi:hypothetical protein
MNTKDKPGDLSAQIQVALDKAIKKLIEEEKARDGYLVRGDKDGKPIKVRARDL